MTTDLLSAINDAELEIRSKKRVLLVMLASETYRDDALVFIHEKMSACLDILSQIIEEMLVDDGAQRDLLSRVCWLKGDTLDILNKVSEVLESPRWD